MGKVLLSVFLIASLFILASAVPVLEAENNKVNIDRINISTVWRKTFEVENFRGSVRSEHFAEKTFTEYY